MHPGTPSLREVVFELSGPPAGGGIDPGAAASALLDLPGVHEAHVDRHGTWALVSFDPAVAALPAITGSLAAHGLAALTMRSLQDSTDKRADDVRTRLNRPGPGPD